MGGGHFIFGVTFKKKTIIRHVEGSPLAASSLVKSKKQPPEPRRSSGKGQGGW